jgi:hypothetical protein
VERKHSSFLLRCWWRRDNCERVEIEHIQSGRREQFDTVTDAVTWICSPDEKDSGPDNSRDPPVPHSGQMHDQTHTARNMERKQP